MKSYSCGTLIRLIALYPLYYAVGLTLVVPVAMKLKGFSLYQAIVFSTGMLIVCVAVHYLTYAAIIRLIKSMARGE